MESIGRLDVQFLPDVDIACPDCDGSRYAPEANAIRRAPAHGDPGNGPPKRSR